jgi:hypothetical protein
LDEDLSHDGGECDFLFFTFQEQLLIEASEFVFMADHGQCDHVEDATCRCSSTPDVACSGELPRVEVVRSQSRQSRDLAAIEGADLGQRGHEGDAGGFSDTGVFFQFCGLGGLVGAGGKRLFDGTSILSISLANWFSVRLRLLVRSLSAT